MNKRLLPILCVVITLMLAAAPLAAASAAYNSGDVGGLFAAQIEKGIGNDGERTGVPLPGRPLQLAPVSGKSLGEWYQRIIGNNPGPQTFMRFFVLNYVDGFAYLLFEDGTAGWFEIPEDNVNQLWGHCGVYSAQSGNFFVSVGMAAALNYGILNEDLTVEINGVDVTFAKGSIIPIYYDEDDVPYLWLPNGTKIPLTGDFTEIPPPYTPPEPEHSASVGSDDGDGDAVNCGCIACSTERCGDSGSTSPCPSYTPRCPCFCCRPH